MKMISHGIHNVLTTEPLVRGLPARQGSAPSASAIGTMNGADFALGEGEGG